ncbi:MAG: tRNA (adenosine(37)-N6)-threonylcarbamoyltransferase complex dimerization subunit type 1 TsaB [candidate division Zixibacteria bacterium]|nr:tRNA (adenosine(37)-N6)-threonylcarbamoyltransferase complex dimerization subunit type 1 TsaB [candidate division Zixibacteria bacterium]
MNESFKNILAIDSSTSVLRVGLRLSDGEIISLENEDRFRHAEFIFQLINKVIKAGSIDRNSLDAIIISTGPGSFTGLRVGLSAAKGLASALNLPLVGVPIFNAIAKGLFDSFGRTAVLIPSRRDEFYFGLIESNGFETDNIEIMKTDEVESKLNNVNVCGIDFDTSTLCFSNERKINIVDYKTGINDFISAGIDKLNTKGGDDLFKIEPFYVQKFIAKKSK